MQRHPKHQIRLVPIWNRQCTSFSSKEDVTRAGAYTYLGLAGKIEWQTDQQPKFFSYGQDQGYKG
jgi:hypothetical protein